MKKHIFIATPAFDGKVNVQYALSLCDTVLQLKENNIEVTLKITTSGSLLVAERNRLLEMFWLSDATHILFIDSDLGFPSKAIIAMLNQEKEFIGGVYPNRPKPNGLEGFMFRPLFNQDGSLVHEKHLLKVESVPAGFMLLSRSALQKMRNYFPELYYAPKDKRANTESTYCLFNTEVYEGEFWGEDYVFCRRAKEAGIDIWVDPLISFDHGGKVGSLCEILTDKPNMEKR